MKFLHWYEQIIWKNPFLISLSPIWKQKKMSLNICFICYCHGNIWGTIHELFRLLWYTWKTSGLDSENNKMVISLSDNGHPELAVTEKWTQCLAFWGVRAWIHRGLHVNTTKGAQLPFANTICSCAQAPLPAANLRVHIPSSSLCLCQENMMVQFQRLFYSTLECEYTTKRALFASAKGWKSKTLQSEYQQLKNGGKNGLITSSSHREILLLDTDQMNGCPVVGKAPSNS